jgi:5-methylcytosine-specific restriction endonuclease McrA
MASTYKLWAPTCAKTDCTNKVGYHNKYIKTDGTPGYKWKAFCSYHRTVGKAERDVFIKSRGGCENVDARCGFKCGDPTTPSLTIDHWDGDRYNNDQDNLVVLCANCHNEKSKRFKDTLNRYSNYTSHFDNLFDFV